MLVQVDVAIVGIALHKHRDSVGTQWRCHNAKYCRSVVRAGKNGQRTGLKVPDIGDHVIDVKIIGIAGDQVFSAHGIYRDDGLFNPDKDWRRLEGSDLSCAVELVEMVVAVASAEEHHIVDGVVQRNVVIAAHRKVSGNSQPLSRRLAVFHDRSVGSGLERDVDQGIPFRKPGYAGTAADVTEDIGGNGRKTGPCLRCDIVFFNDRVAERTMVQLAVCHIDGSVMVSMHGIGARKPAGLRQNLPRIRAICIRDETGIAWDWIVISPYKKQLLRYRVPDGIVGVSQYRSDGAIRVS